MKLAIRFDVFKRDSFTCCYCGRRPPEVVLEVDHIDPVSNGGTDAFENLLTACFDCNRGKGAKLLEERPAAARTPTQEEMAERIAQARAFSAYQAEIEALVAEDLDRIWEAWCAAFKGSYDAEANVYRCDAGFPSEAQIREKLKRLTPSEIIQAIRITADKKPFFRSSRGQQSRMAYFFGVLRRMLEQRGGGAG